MCGLHVTLADVKRCLVGLLRFGDDGCLGEQGEKKDSVESFESL